MNEKQEYAPNGKPIVYELFGDDKTWHCLYLVGVWAIIITAFFSLIIWGITGDWEALGFSLFGLIIGVPSIIAGKVKCSVVYRLTEEKKKSRRTAIIFIVVLFIVGIIYFLINGSSDSGWNSLSDEEKDDARSAASFYEEVQEAIEKYES